ncbi:hypothetical protein [Paraburkholderia sp. BR10882]|uniref:hypothetical protein n=1 Tax=unclassified Paraburkholderia TaxID=2615204 RepID=UPI0034CD97D8
MANTNLPNSAQAILAADRAAQNAKFNKQFTDQQRINKHRERCKKLGLNPFTTKAADLPAGDPNDSYDNYVMPSLDGITRLSTALFVNHKTNVSGKTSVTYTLQADVWTDPVTVAHKIGKPERKVYFNLQSGKAITYKANEYVNGGRTWKDGKQVRGDSLMTEQYRDFYLEKVQEFEATVKQAYPDAVIYAGFCKAMPDRAAKLGTKTITSQFVVIAVAGEGEEVDCGGKFYQGEEEFPFCMSFNPNEKQNAPLLIGSFCAEQMTEQQYDKAVLEVQIEKLKHKPIASAESDIIDNIQVIPGQENHLQLASPNSAVSV